MLRSRIQIGKRDIPWLFAQPISSLSFFSSPEIWPVAQAQRESTSTKQMRDLFHLNIY